ncbi:hypothetical protein PAXRUDRAFT_835897 [Paxillus rubicundulus Ve08.2h10]|uniref:Uncharacterized protein n=1 Tax=Paxillus rubicundulus Ve08.2h10 TaxID=930991 RepID=A0A0D0BTM3_9AGAM|nr:hypothetical protein PAXRUDRAFT_835897 [Paxillus rubicundulus Ve08.2h10]
MASLPVNGSPHAVQALKVRTCQARLHAHTRARTTGRKSEDDREEERGRQGKHVVYRVASL